VPTRLNGYTRISGLPTTYLSGKQPKVLESTDTGGLSPRTSRHVSNDDDDEDEDDLVADSPTALTRFTSRSFFGIGTPALDLIYSSSFGGVEKKTMSLTEAEVHRNTSRLIIGDSFSTSIRSLGKIDGSMLREFTKLHVGVYIHINIVIYRGYTLDLWGTLMGCTVRSV
jgi:hypothetical protein